MKKIISILLTAVFISLCAGPFMPPAKAFVPSPNTQFAADFIRESEGQQWFLDEIERMLNLQETSINDLRGTDDLKTIVSLGLNGQAVWGGLPSAIGRLTNLRHIFLGSKGLTGPIPSQITALKRLEHIDLSDNELTGSIPIGINNLTKLKTLILWGNNLEGAVPNSLGNTPMLENLDLAYNNLTGQLPDSLGSLQKLKFLSISNNSFDTTIPDALGGMPNILAIIAWNAGLKGSIPAALGNAATLNILDLAENDLEGAIPSALGNITALEQISLRANRLSGVIPAELGRLSSLTLMDFSNNLLSGQIPDALGGLQAMQRLYLSFNELEGPINPALGSLSELNILDVSNNRLSGSIPEALETLTKLKSMNLSDNILTGTIPDIFADMLEIEEINLSGNKLVGDAAASLKAHETANVTVHLERNYLAGGIVQTMNHIEDNFADTTAFFENIMTMPDSGNPDGIYVLKQYNTVNLYDAFFTLSNQTGEVSEKAKLDPADYEYEVLYNPNNAVKITEDIYGVHVKVLDYISQDEPVVLQYKIKANTGEYSKTTIKIASQYEEPNRSPLAQNVVITGIPCPGGTLGVSYDYTDREGDAQGVVRYRWKLFNPETERFEILEEETGAQLTVPRGAPGNKYRAYVMVSQYDGQSNEVWFKSRDVEIINGIYNLEIAVDYETDIMTISGMSNTSDGWVVIQVDEPGGQLYYAGSTDLDSGAFILSFKMLEPVAGVYTVWLKTANMAEPQMALYEYSPLTATAAVTGSRVTISGMYKSGKQIDVLVTDSGGGIDYSSGAVCDEQGGFSFEYTTESTVYGVFTVTVTAEDRSEPYIFTFTYGAEPSGLTIDQIDVNDETNTVTISGGVTGTPGWVTCYVEGPEGRLEYIGSALVWDGGYEIRFGLQEPKISGIYTVTLKAEGMSRPVTDTFEVTYSAQGMSIDVNNETNTVTISGEVADTAGWVTCYVEGPEGRLEYIGSALVWDGGYEIEFGLQSPIISGTYAVTVKAEGRELLMTDTFEVDAGARTMSSIIELQCVQGEQYIVGVTAEESDVGEHEFVVTYDISMLDVLDPNTQPYTLGSGVIADDRVELIESAPGRIRFRITDESAAQGGVVNWIKFKALEDGAAAITLNKFASSKGGR